MIKYSYTLLALLILTLSACQKLEGRPDVVEIPTTDFKLSTGNSAYLTQVVDLAPNAEYGKAQTWTCNFGDGSNDIKGNTIMPVSHMYVKAGQFKVTFTTNGKTVTKTIRIFPGLRSYQIKNLASKQIDLQAAVGYGTTDLNKIGLLKTDALSDTIFVAATDNGPVELKIYGFRDVDTWDPLNQKISWTRTQSPQLPQYVHTVVELKDSDQIYYYHFFYNLAQRIDTNLGRLLQQ